MTAGYLPAALEALKHGLCPVPVAGDGTKRPALATWRQYQKHLPDDDDLSAWFVRPIDKPAGIGLICGAVSGGLEMVEVEGRIAGRWAEIIERARAAGLGDLIERIDAGYRERTPSGGIHWLIRCATIEGNRKLARNTAGEVTLETRGEGGFVVVAPTDDPRAHPTGKPWELRRGGFATIATITPEERTDLFELLATFDETPETVPGRTLLDMPRSPGMQTHDHVIGLEDRPGDLYNREHTWADILEPEGWVHLWRHGLVDYWRRPGKTAGVSATTNALGTDRLKVFSTSTPFDTETTYDRFGAYALLHHGGRVTEAARALRPSSETTLFAASANTAETEDADAPSHLDVLKSKLVDLDQLANLPPPTPLIDNIIFANSLAVLYGTPGCGKTFVALDWSLSVSVGREWLGRQSQQGGVLYVAAEGASGLLKRVRAWQQTRETEPGDIVMLPEAVNLRDPAWGPAMVALVAERRPALVVIDTLARSMPGADENASQDMGIVVEVAEAIKRASNACVLLIHHDTKAGGTPRGSSALIGAVDTIVAVSRKGNIVTLRNRAPEGKQKDAAEFDDVVVELREVDVDDGRSLDTTSLAVFAYDGPVPDDRPQAERPRYDFELEVMELVYNAIHAKPGTSKRAIRSALLGAKIGVARQDKAIEMLVGCGFVSETKGHRNALLYEAVDLFQRDDWLLNETELETRRRIHEGIQEDRSVIVPENTTGPACNGPVRNDMKGPVGHIRTTRTGHQTSNPSTGPARGFPLGNPAETGQEDHSITLEDL